MSLYRENLSLYHAEGDDVTFYPVDVESIDAYLSAGGEGATVRGLFYIEDVLVQDGDIPVEAEEPNLEVLETVADAAGMAARTTSIEFAGERYRLISRRLSDPGFVRFPLERYVDV